MWSLAALGRRGPLPPPILGALALAVTPAAAQIGTVRAEQELSESVGGFGGDLADHDEFGSGVCAIGDLDGNGTRELAVGAPRADVEFHEEGALWILFMAPDGTVSAQREITDSTGGFGGDLSPSYYFGASVAALGDVDGDGTPDLAVGSPGDDDGGSAQGAVWILFMNPDGTVSSEQKISETTGGFGGVLQTVDHFGCSVAGVGDLDGDGTPDLAVGADRDDDGGTNSVADRGAVWILFLNPDGTVASHRKISQTQGGLGTALQNRDRFGFCVAGLGDLDLDGTRDLAVGVAPDGEQLSDPGLWILFLEPDGGVSSKQKISETTGGFVGAPGSDYLCRSIASLGLLDGDAVPDLAVGAWHDDGGPIGAVYVLFLEGDTLAPALACPTAVTRIDRKLGPPGEIVTFSVSATDDHDAAPSVVCVPPSGSLFPRGTTLVTCTATDAFGNVSECVFPVTVRLPVEAR